jgi:hypothetical protein
MKLGGIFVQSIHGCWVVNDPPNDRSCHVFAGRRKPQALSAETTARQLTSETTDKAPQREHLEEWRRAAMRVTRAWNSWLAADRHDRPVRYQAFVSALAEEERAAARVELMAESAGMGRRATAIVPDAADH